MDTYMHKTMASVASLEKIEIIRSQEFMPSKARLKFLKKMIILGPKTAILGPQFCRILVLGPHFWWSGGLGVPPGSASDNVSYTPSKLFASTSKFPYVSWNRLNLSINGSNNLLTIRIIQLIWISAISIKLIIKSDQSLTLVICSTLHTLLTFPFQQEHRQTVSTLYRVHEYLEPCRHYPHALQ